MSLYHPSCPVTRAIMMIRKPFLRKRFHGAVQKSPSSSMPWTRQWTTRRLSSQQGRQSNVCVLGRSLAALLLMARILIFLSGHSHLKRTRCDFTFIVTISHKQLSPDYTNSFCVSLSLVLFALPSMCLYVHIL